MDENSEVDFTYDEPVDGAVQTDRYTVDQDDDLKSVFDVGFAVIEGTIPPTRTLRVDAHNAGYRLRTTESGWEAVRKG